MSRYQRIEGHCSFHDGVLFFTDTRDDSGFCPLCEYEGVDDELTTLRAVAEAAKQWKAKRDEYERHDGSAEWTMARDRILAHEIERDALLLVATLGSLERAEGAPTTTPAPAGPPPRPDAQPKNSSGASPAHDAGSGARASDSTEA